VESTVIDGLAADGCLRVLRPGGVTVEDMERVLAAGNLSSRVLVHRRDYQDQTIAHAPTTPGMKYRHYSPSVPVLLFITSAPPSGEEASTLSDVFSLHIHTALPPKLDYWPHRTLLSLSFLPASIRMPRLGYSDTRSPLVPLPTLPLPLKDSLTGF
jgi:Threonylcarbamoyl-AMP synthase, C-terminal domain